MEEEKDIFKPPQGDGSGKPPSDEEQRRTVRCSRAWIEETLNMLSPELKRMEDEIRALKKENDELKERNWKTNQLYTDSQLELHDMKKRYDDMKTLLDSCTECPAGEDDLSRAGERMYFAIDTRKFQNSTTEWQHRLWMFILSFVRSAASREYTLSLSTTIVPIYMLLSDEGSAHCFLGSRDDFSYLWNENVAHYLDGSLKTAMTCKATALNAVVNRPPWKGVSPMSWRKMVTESAQFSKQYSQALEIKKRFQSIVYEQS